MAPDHGRVVPTPAALQLPDSAAGWLAELAALPDPGAADLPPAAQLSERLHTMGLGPAERAEISEAGAIVAADPGLRWLTARAGAQLAGLRAGLDDPVPATGGGWPTPQTPSSELLRRWLWVVVFAAALPALQRWHAKHGIDRVISDATVADVGDQAAAHRRQHGTPGLSEQAWLRRVFGGRLLRVGRLQVEIQPTGADAAALTGAGLAPDTATVAAHIPASGGPLTPESVDDFLVRAGPAASSLTGVRPALLSCASWLLDPQLAQHLPIGSNIVAFGRRFQLLPRRPGDEPDEDVLKFAFEVPAGTPLDRLPRRTTLHRALADHLGAGGHWWARSGWLRLPAPGRGGPSWEEVRP